MIRTDNIPRRLQHVLSKRCAQRGGVCVVWATAASWVASVEKGNGGGGVAHLLPALAPPSLSNHRRSLFVIVDAADGMCRYPQTSWHVRKVPLTCHVVTATR
jgi:hypothetical protein